MSKEKVTNILIESLNEIELYQIAKAYLKEVEGINNVIVCNGPWDSGIDLSMPSFEVQIQATIQQKNFEKKLFIDISKARSNSDKYSLPNKVKYFYSHSLSNKSILSYRKKAKDNHNIYLEIIDANRITEVASEFGELNSLLYDLSDLGNFQTQSAYFDNVKVKAYYDLMSFGKSTDIKYNIIKSFLLNYLFNNSLTTKEILLSKTNEHFSSNMDENYLKSVLARLSSEQKIKIGKDELILQDNERDRINLVLQNYRIEEGLLLRDISNVLKKNNINDSVDIVLKQLSELYESTYSINLSELTHKDVVINDLKTVTLKLRELITKISNDLLTETEVDSLIKLLIKIADASEILPRIAAGQVYSKVSDPDRLERYVNQNINNKTIFLDANVILNLLLVDYEPEAEYKNYNYVIANNFYKFYNSNGLILKTIPSYSKEIASIFKDALSLIPFSKLKVFSSLGGSSNIFYKFYQHLKDHYLLRDGVETFEDFLKGFRFNSRTRVDDNYRSQMEYLLKSLNIEIEELETYDYSKGVDIIRDYLKENNRTKSNFAVVSDALMFERLADNNSEINPVDPIFCTWDISLMKVRKVYFEKYPGCTKWYMFTPTRLMDHISMMNFQIKPGTVSNEVLTILDQDFSFQQMTHTLLDSMATIINAENVVGLRYTNMLADLREKEIVEVDAKIESGVIEAVADTPPIDVIFRELFENYMLSKENKADSFKKIFTKEEYFEEIISIITEETKHISKEHTLSNNLFKSIDVLVEKEQQLFKESIGNILKQ